MTIAKVPPRVLIWRERLLPISETFISNHVRALKRWDPILAGSRYVAPSLPIGEEGIALYGMHGPSSAMKAFNWRVTGRSRKLESHMQEWRPQLIHAHFGPDATYILPTAQRHSLPLIATFHGADATSMKQGAMPSIYRSRLRLLFSRAAALHAVSDFIADQLVTLGAPPEKVTRMYIGIPCAGEPPAVQSNNSVLFVGRLVEKKGLGDLLDAMSRLPDPLKRTPLHIIGDGPLKDAWRRDAENRGLKATFHGAQPSDFVARLMRECTVFCVPSRTASNGDSEGLGMVFLEAGLHSLPVVSYRHGGIPEAVSHGETGLLAPEGDIATLSQHISLMLEQPDRATQFGIAARTRVMRCFDIERQISRLEDFYDQIVESSRHAG
ncbi:hypothetical protein A5757_21345 [Mycobacterium sp. 852013-51886_SCH5428379]|nr:hypothetical protein A5757_21345 [Mycobacterium sp. 852013-51886_SCH5428379]